MGGDLEDPNDLLACYEDCHKEFQACLDADRRRNEAVPASRDDAGAVVDRSPQPPAPTPRKDTGARPGGTLAK